MAISHIRRSSVATVAARLILAAAVAVPALTLAAHGERSTPAPAQEQTRVVAVAAMRADLTWG